MRQLIAAALHPHDYKWGLRPWRRHSAAVLAAGCVYIAIGITYMLSTPTESRTSSLVLALEVMPLRGWGVVWIVAGTLAVISARWPPASETWGYSALSGLTSLWASFYVLGVLVMGAPMQSLTAGLMWGLIAFLWWIIAGLRNPDTALIIDARAPLAPPRREDGQ